MSIQVAELVATLALDRGTFTRDMDQAQSGFTQLGARAQAAGAQTAQVFSQTSAEAKKLADATVAAAEKAVRAQNRVADSVESVRRAEVDLGRARSSGDAERVLRAEANLERARRNSETATRAATRAEEAGFDALRRYRTAAENAARANDQMRDSANDAARAHGRLGDQVANTNPFSRLTAQAREAGTDAGEGLAEGLPGPIAAAARAGGPIGMAVMAIAAVGIMAGKALADNIAQGLAIQAERGLANAKFGWTPEQATQAGKAAADAYGNAWGESVSANREAAGIAIHAGLIDGNATAAEIQPVIEKLNVLTTMMGTEVPETARAAGQMVKTGLAKDAAEAFDLLAAAQRGGLNVSGDLLDTITEYGTQYRKLGLDGATALGTVQQMMKGGARDTDIAADALKEFSIRVVDGSKDTTDAFESLKLGPEETAAAFAKGGESAKKMTQTVWTALSQIQDPVERNRIGLQLFGTQWEDLGGAISRMDLSKASSALGEVGGAANRAGEQMGGAAADIQAAKNKLSNAGDEIKVKMAEAFGPVITDAAQFVSEHIDEITAGLKLLAGGAVSAAGGMTAAFGGILWAVSKVTEGIAFMLESFIRAQGAVGGMIAKIPGMQGVGEAIQNGANSAADMVSKFKTGAGTAADLGAALAEGGAKAAMAGAKMGFSGTEAAGASEAFGKLGIKVRETPDGKYIQVTDNTPESIEKLRQLGLKVTTLPNGNVVIDAKDEEAKRKIAEITKPETKKVNVEVVNNTAYQLNTAFDALDRARAAQGLPPIDRRDVPKRAAGGPITGPGTGTSDSIPALLSDGEFVVNAASTRANFPLLEAINSGRIARFADGGAVQTAAAVNSFPRQKGLEGDPYVWGGVNWGDCSGAMSAIANFATGRDPFASRFATMTEGSELAARGFKSGKGPAGTLRIGWFNGGPYGGHTAGTLPDGTNVEMGGGRGNGQVGGKAAGADDPQFTDHAYLPLGDSGETIGGDPGSAGTSGSAGTDSTGASTTGTGDGDRVFVTNWPDKLGGATTTNNGGQFKFSLFADGGPVSGPGGPRDDKIPAMLSNGEFVVNAMSARANYPLLESINRGGALRLAGGGPVIAPKIEAPKLPAPAVAIGPGSGIPIPGVSGAGTVGAPAVSGVGVDPLAALTGGNPLTGGTKQGGVDGTFNAQEYTVQRLIQYGGDMAKVAIEAGKGIALPSGLDSQQAQNVLGLIKGVGGGMKAAHEKAESSATSKSADGKTTNITNNHTWNVSSPDEAFRNLKRDEGRKALTYDGSLT